MKAVRPERLEQIFPTTIHPLLQISGPASLLAGMLSFM